MTAVEDLSLVVGMKRACRELAIPRSSVYRRRRRRLSPPPVGAWRSSARRLKDEEKSAVLACLHEERFQDCSPSQVYASLLDDGRYHCSIRTMYRLLDAEGENRERRDQLIHPPYRKPELLATGPNQLWSWDITKLRGPVKWSFYYLYVILDVFSRYVTGWMIAYRETAGLAKQLIEHSCEKQKIVPGQLTIHADRGSSMTSKSVALLLADLGVIKTHSRPHVSDDNPLWLHPGCPPFLPGVLSLVQPPPPSFGLALVHPGHRASPSDRSAHLATPGRPRPRLPEAPRALRPAAASTPVLARRCLDQSTSFQQGKYSLNFYAVCLILVDTFRFAELGNPGQCGDL
jgi:transposase InsO family protein